MKKKRSKWRSSTWSFPTCAVFVTSVIAWQEIKQEAKKPAPPESNHRASVKKVGGGGGHVAELANKLGKEGAIRMGPPAPGGLRKGEFVSSVTWRWNTMLAKSNVKQLTWKTSAQKLAAVNSQWQFSVQDGVKFCCPLLLFVNFFPPHACSIRFYVHEVYCFWRNVLSGGRCTS